MLCPRINWKTVSSLISMLIVFYAFYTLIQWTPVDAANILAAETVPGKSHWNVMRSVLRALTNSGHTVTVFTPFIDGDRDGYKEIDMSKQIKQILDMNVTYLVEIIGKTRKLMPIMANVTRADCNTIYENRLMVDIMNGLVERKFDLVVIEPFMSECVAYVATVLRVPMIYVVPTPISTFMERSLTGHIPNPAAVSHVLSRRRVPKTFIHRFVNAMLTVYCSMLIWHAEHQHRMADPQPYDTVELVKPSVIFSNTHFITEPARPLTPDVVEIGGIHLTPPEPIPKVIIRARKL